MTAAIVLLNLVLFEAAWVHGGNDGVQSLFQALALSPDRIWAGEWWRLLSCGAVHGNWHHVIGNCLFLLVVGLELEPELGSVPFALAYLVTTLGGSVASLGFVPTSAGGSSAGLYGLFGVLLARPTRTDAQGKTTISLWWLATAATVAIGIGFGQDDPEICLSAHAGALVTGLWYGVLATRDATTWRFTRIWTQRLAVALLATVGFVAALAPAEHLRLVWHWNQAKQAQSRGDVQVANRHWNAIESEADPHTPLGAYALEATADAMGQQGDFEGARSLLGEIASTLNRSYVYRDLGALWVSHGSRNEGAAEAAFRKALELEPCEPVTLNAAAMLFVFGDSIRFSPERARALARDAVREDGGHTAEFLATLAWADYYCGDEDSAIRGMQQVIRMDASRRKFREGDLALMKRAES